MVNTMSLTNDISLEKIEGAEKQLSSIIFTGIERGADYVIKSLPIPDLCKNVLIEAKEIFTNKNFKEVVEKVVKSTVYEGMQILGINDNSIKNLLGLAKVANRGGLYFGLEGMVDLFEKEYLDSRITSDYVYMFFDRVKEYVLSNKFVEKTLSTVERYDSKVDKYLEKCQDWYKAYEEKDLEGIVSIAESLSKNIANVRNNTECKTENELIQNITGICRERNRLLNTQEFNILRVK